MLSSWCCGIHAKDGYRDTLQNVNKDLSPNFPYVSIPFYNSRSSSTALSRNWVLSTYAYTFCIWHIDIMEWSMNISSIDLQKFELPCIHRSQQHLVWIISVAFSCLRLGYSYLRLLLITCPQDVRIDNVVRQHKTDKSSKSTTIDDCCPRFSPRMPYPEVYGRVCYPVRGRWRGLPFLLFLLSYATTGR